MNYREKIKEVVDLLGCMHESNDSCGFNGGEGCMACMCQEILGDVLLTVSLNAAIEEDPNDDGFSERLICTCLPDKTSNCDIHGYSDLLSKRRF